LAARILRCLIRVGVPLTPKQVADTRCQSQLGEEDDTANGGEIEQAANGIY
jgi:hypothetical protein